MDPSNKLVYDVSGIVKYLCMGMVEIKDTFEDLVLIHHSHNVPEEELDPLKLLFHGTIVDVKKKVIVCSGMPNSRNFHLSDPIKISNQKFVGSIHDGEIMSIEPYNITEAFEGVVIRVFKYNGKIFVSSSKKIHCENGRSTFAGHVSIQQIFSDCGWDRDLLHLLFEKKENEKKVFHFSLEHPELQIISLKEIKPHIIYIGYTMQGNENLDRGIVSKSLSILNVPRYDSPSVLPFARNIRTYSLTKALDVMRGDSSVNDYRITGEQIFVFAKSIGRFLPTTWKICGPSVSWRMNFAKRHASFPEQRLCGALGDAGIYKPEALMGRYIPFDVRGLSNDDIFERRNELQKFPLLLDPNIFVKYTLAECKKLIFANVLAVTPYALRENMLEFLYSYDESFERLTKGIDVFYRSSMIDSEKLDSYKLPEGFSRLKGFDEKIKNVLDEIQKDVRRLPLSHLLCQLPGGTFTNLRKHFMNIHVLKMEDGTHILCRQFHISE